MSDILYFFVLVQLTSNTLVCTPLFTQAQLLLSPNELSRSNVGRQIARDDRQIVEWEALDTRLYLR